jgi:pteridine reductase
MNRNALITGASKRIGRAMAEHLAAKGWNLVVHYNTSPGEAQELAAALSGKYPGQVFKTAGANFLNLGETQTLVATAIQKLGNLNLLVNNASVFEPGNISETPPELFDRQFAINFRAPFVLMQNFKNLCNEGNIVSLVDARITSNKPGYAAYTLSKKTLWKLTKMSAVEFAPAIRVNAIAPGLTLPPAGKGEDYLNRLAQNIPMKKTSGIEPVLKCLDFILENEHLTGQLLFADGGENLIK